MANKIIEKMFRVLIICHVIKWVITTIDVNLAELQYLADHMNMEECRQLIAALHEKSYELSTNIDSAVQQIPEESCLKLLLHWNSMPGEGRGENHEFISRRLQQLGKQELAEWLSRTVYHQLGQDLNNSLLGNPFKDNEVITDQVVTDYEEQLQTNSHWSSNSWIVLDIVFYFIITLLVASLLFLLAALVWKSCLNCKQKTNDGKDRKYKTNPKVKGHYIPLQDATLLEENTEWARNTTI